MARRAKRERTYIRLVPSRHEQDRLDLLPFLFFRKCSNRDGPLFSEWAQASSLTTGSEGTHDQVLVECLEAHDYKESTIIDIPPRHLCHSMPEAVQH
jgi:hypothetical protein